MEGRQAQMTPVYIVDAHVVTALGSGVESLFGGVTAGEKGFNRVDRFDTRAYASPYAGLISGLSFSIKPEETSAVLTLARKLLKGRVPMYPADSENSLYPINSVDPLGPEDSLDPRTLLITASTKGPVDLIRHGQGSPVASLPGQLAGELGLDRPGFNINAACASSTIALAKGADLIRRGREHTVLIVALDVITEFVFSGFSAIGAMSASPAMPFDRDRQGLTLGEGAAFLLLMGKDRMEQINRRALAEIRGWGIACDAAHLTAPDRTGSGLKKAVVQACKSADTSLDSIHVINAHGTGTRYNDAMEIEVFQTLFNPRTLMANSIKGSIGHTLGAAGAIEAVLCTKILEKKVLPGTPGLSHPAEGAGTIFSRDNREFTSDSILTTNSGFGGINAALILGGVR